VDGADTRLRQCSDLLVDVPGVAVVRGDGVGIVVPQLRDVGARRERAARARKDDAGALPHLRAPEGREELTLDRRRERVQLLVPLQQDDASCAFSANLAEQVGRQGGKTSGVPTTALVLALIAAVGHAVWNMLLARARDPEAATAVAMLVGVVAFAAPAAIDWHVERSVWPYVVGSAVFELVYIALLAAAYRRSDLSLIYPVGRGVAPVLVLVVGVVALGAGTTVAQAAGICLVAAGVFLVRGPRRDADLRGVTFGLAIGACIAAYTLIDNSGVERASALSYLELVMILPAFGYALFVAFRRGPGALRAEVNAGSVAAGLLILTPYSLFLIALDLAPAAPVAAVRETSIVVATALGALVLKERVGRGRWAGAVLVAGGVALVAV